MSLPRAMVLVAALAVGLGSLWALGGFLLAGEIDEDPALVLLVTLPVPMTLGMLVGMYVALHTWRK